MLLVTIANFDDTYHGVFETDNQVEAAEAALADLVAHNGFFQDNRIVTTFPSALIPDAGVYGILLMPDEGQSEEDLEDRCDSINTYWVQVQEYKSGTMIAS